jgi:AcrR family transcriptional regulator
MSIEERQREEKEQRRQSILDAAERVLRDKRVDALTVSDVASEARLSRSLMYVYFEDLDDIVLAVTLRGFESLHRRFAAAVAQHGVGLMQIRAIGEAYVGFAREEPVYFDLLARFEARASDPDDAASHEAQCLAMGDRVMDVMTGAIQAGIDDGSIRPTLDPTETALTLWGYTHGLIQLAAHKGTMFDRRHNVSADALVEKGLDLAGVALTGWCEAKATDVPAEALEKNSDGSPSSG